MSEEVAFVCGLFSTVMAESGSHKYLLILPCLFLFAYLVYQAFGSSRTQNIEWKLKY